MAIGGPDFRTTGLIERSGITRIGSWLFATKNVGAGGTEIVGTFTNVLTSRIVYEIIVGGEDKGRWSIATGSYTLDDGTAEISGSIWTAATRSLFLPLSRPIVLQNSVVLQFQVTNNGSAAADFEVTIGVEDVDI